MKSTELISIDPEILGGQPVFKGTRVPVESLFDYLEVGMSLDEFIEEFPTVTVPVFFSKYGLENFYKGIETIPYFHKYYAEIKK